MVPLVNRLCWRFLLCATILWPLQPGTLARDFVFADSLAAGKLQIAQSEKLLVVIHATGDFTGPVFALPGAQTFHQLTLRDPSVTAASHDRCVFVCQPIGRPTSVDGNSRRGDLADSPRTDNVVTYFCSGEGLVLHYLVGFVGPDELLDGLAWAERVQRESQLKRQLAERRDLVAGWHRIRIADSKSVSLLPKSDREPSSADGTELSAGELRTLVAAAWEIRGRQLLERFGGNFSNSERTALLHELTKHGEPRTDFPHLVLTIQPLLPLPRLQRHIAGVCLRSEFWEVSPRREELAEWVFKQKHSAQIVLLIISSNTELEPLSRRKLTEVSWRPNSALLIPLLQQSVVSQITASELVTLWQDLKFDPQLLVSRQPPRFILIDAMGAVGAVLDGRNNEAPLARTLSQVMSFPFASVTDTAAEPGASVPPIPK